MLQYILRLWCPKVQWESPRDSLPYRGNLALSSTLYWNCFWEGHQWLLTCQIQGTFKRKMSSLEFYWIDTICYSSILKFSIALGPQYQTLLILSYILPYWVLTVYGLPFSYVLPYRVLNMTIFFMNSPCVHH